MKKTILTLIGILLVFNLIAQQDSGLIVDKIAAKIGDRIILLSDVETQYLQYLAEGHSASKQAKCNVLENLMIQKLLLNQADIDSVFVSDDEVETEVENRIYIFVQQMGGEAQLEQYLNKSIFEIKEDLKKVLKDQLRAEKEKQQIIGDVSVTPSEVRKFYDSMPKDSLPDVDAQVEVQQIVIYPKLTKDEEELTLQKIREIREKIVSGKRKFASMARMYSQDEASARKGGELGFHSRSELEPEFAAAAFSLKKGEVSDIVKTKYGYHIIQLIERKGERINVRHILIKPIIPQSAIKRTMAYADSVYNLIINDSLTFEKAALLFSEDDNTKNNGGLLFNQLTGSAKFSMDELPSNIKFDIEDLKEGEISKPMKTTDEAGNIVIKIYKLKSKIPPHRANIKDDYQLIMNMALEHKKAEIFDNWVKEQLKEGYFSIDKDFRDCKFKYKGWLKPIKEE